MSFDCSEDNELEELQKSIQEDRGIADDEKDQAIRERARERIIEYRERIDALENEREELEEGTSLKESESQLPRSKCMASSRGSRHIHGLALSKEQAMNQEG